MKRTALALTTFFALLMVAPLAAQNAPTTPTGSALMPQPGHYILGVVTDVSSSTVSVRTGLGEQMTFDVDSRTVKPTVLGTGGRVRIEYHTMDSGAQLAGRVTPIEPGSADWSMLDQQMSSSTQTEETTPATTHEEMEHTSASTTTTHEANELRSDRGATDNNGSTYSRTNGDVDRSELPQTASEQPWLLVLGLAALTLLAGMWIGRHQRRV